LISFSSIKKFFKRTISSKYFVFFAIAIFWMCGSVSNVAKADSDYPFGAVFQYYLLDNRGGEVKESAEDDKVALSMGSLGSGGVSGTFSYDDIVNSASSNNKEVTKSFASTMATYATFNYFGNKIQGFESVLTYIGRFLATVILLPLAILMDLLNLVVPTLISLIAKFNVIQLLGSAFSNLGITSDLANALGISKGAITSFVNAVMSFAIVMILISLAGTFKRGGKNIDQSHAKKLKGRLFSLIALPLIVVGSATLLDEVIKLTATDTPMSGQFSKYMVDTRSWAYNFNFAPRGNSDANTDIRPSKTSSYVDLRMNPYTADGQARIASINSKSSLTGDDSSIIFPNTALVLSFGSSESFSALDFINYKGTQASQSYYGRTDGDGKSFGSYYQYAENMKKQLADIDNAYTGTGGDSAQGNQKGSYASAIKDYADGDKLLVTPQIAWRDRFIYGAKSAGNSLDEYYNELPSQEMIRTQVGTNNGGAISNQSMFLILSTIFDETGGRYYIDAPARGIMQVKASFDSNRSTYFVVSMVGNPFFTMFGLVSQPIIQLVVLLAVLTAIFSLGIIEMNTKPLSAWLKGITLGDMEYSQAFIIYAVGIGATVLMMTVVPPLIATAILAIASLIKAPALAFNTEAISPQASLALEGTPLIFTAVVAMGFAFIYFKSPSFRHKLIDLFTMPWAWAKSTGERLEWQASGGAGIRISQEQKRMRDRNKVNTALDTANKNGTSVFGAVKDLANQTLNDINPNRQPYSPSDEFENSNQQDSANQSTDSANSVNKVNDLKRKGMFTRTKNGLVENQLDNEVSAETKNNSSEAEDAVETFKNEPTEENYKQAQNRLLALRDQMENEGYSPEKIKRVDDVIQNFNDIGKEYDIENSDNPDIVQSLNNKNIGDNSNQATETNPSTEYDESKNIDLTKHDEESADTSNHSETKNPTSINTISNTTEQTINNTDMIRKEKLSELHEGLGDAISNPQVANAVKTITESTDEATTKQGISQLKSSISNLNNQELETLNHKKVLDSLKGMVSYSPNPSSITNITNTKDISNVNTETLNNTYSDITNNKDVHYSRESLVPTLKNSLGDASHNPNVQRAINSLAESKDNDDFKRNVTLLKESFNTLKPNEKEGIDHKKVLQTLENMIKYRDIKGK
jgi:hypothetical protein